MSKDKLSGRKTLQVAPILEELEKDRLKASIDIVALFSSFGVSLAHKGSGYVGLCPWHEDSTPSLSVNREKGLYNCFGCGESGDAFSLVQKTRGLDFKGALAYLKGIAGSLPAAPRLEPAPAERPQAERVQPAVVAVAPAAVLKVTPTSAGAASLVDLADVDAHYQSTLRADPVARAYLSSRGLDVPELHTSFGLGYADGSLRQRLSDEQASALTALGFFSAQGHEHFERCIVVPLTDEQQQIVGFYGRKIDGSKPEHLYLKGGHKGLCNRAAASVYRDQLILTEAVLDAVSLYALGVMNVMPCYGVNGFTAAHEALLKAERVECVVLAFDADDSGRRGTQDLAERLLGLGFSIKRIESPIGKDWNDFLTGGGTGATVNALVQAAPLETLPSSGLDDLSMKRQGGKVIFARAGVTYRLSGVRDSFQAALRVGVRMEAGGRTIVDTVDLYSGRSRASFAQAGGSIGLEVSRVEADLLLMLEQLEADRARALLSSDEAKVEVSPTDRIIALQFLSDPALFERIIDDLSSLGYVGEDVNKLLVYLAASSRKLDDPVSVIVSSQSAAGKSYLIDTVKKLMPEEEVVSMTSLSDQALNYLPDDALLHKFLIMGEAAHSESVEHQLREMLSAKELARLVTMKDEKTGEMTSKLVRKDVIVSMVMSTTSVDVNPENASRSFVVAADETEAQTKAIHDSQRRKYSLERLSNQGETKAAIIARHKAAQRLLEKVAIVNPFAHLVNFPSRLMRTRRDNERFLDLIACVAFLRQCQKQILEHAGGQRYIVCDVVDYRIAWRIMKAILPLTLSNFPAAAEALYAAIRSLIQAKAERHDLGVLDCEVSQREIREATGLSHMNVKRTMRTLVEYEFLISTGLASRGARRGYRLMRDEALELVDLSALVSPEELAGQLALSQSGASGSDWVTSGSDPLGQG